MGINFRAENLDRVTPTQASWKEYCKDKRAIKIKAWKKSERCFILYILLPHLYLLMWVVYCSSLKVSSTISSCFNSANTGGYKKKFASPSFSLPPHFTIIILKMLIQESLAFLSLNNHLYGDDFRCN